MITQPKTIVTLTLLIGLLAGCGTADVVEPPAPPETGAQIELAAPLEVDFWSNHLMEVYLRDSVAGANGVKAKFTLLMKSAEDAPAVGTFDIGLPSYSNNMGQLVSFNTGKSWVDVVEVRGIVEFGPENNYEARIGFYYFGYPTDLDVPAPWATTKTEVEITLEILEGDNVLPSTKTLHTYITHHNPE